MSETEKLRRQNDLNHMEHERQALLNVSRQRLNTDLKGKSHNAMSDSLY